MWRIGHDRWITARDAGSFRSEIRAHSQCCEKLLPAFGFGKRADHFSREYIAKKKKKTKPYFLVAGMFCPTIENPITAPVIGEVVTCFDEWTNALNTGAVIIL